MRQKLAPEVHFLLQITIRAHLHTIVFVIEDAYPLTQWLVKYFVHFHGLSYHVKQQFGLIRSLCVIQFQTLDLHLLLSLFSYRINRTSTDIIESL